MQPQILVVSDPPHPGVDHQAVADTLGLSVEDAQLKLRFPAPEVLSASGQLRAGDIAQALRGAGLGVATIDGHRLADLPWPTPVSSFSFGEAALTARTAFGEIALPYETSVVGVSCRPPADCVAPAKAVHGSASDSDGLAIAESIEWIAHIDLYATVQGQIRRLTFVDRRTDFAGLDSPTLTAFIDECRRRFLDIDMDRRLEGVRPRQRIVMGETGFDIDLRKLFSFGTLLLRQVLDSVSPDLRDVTQHEFGSRMAYVISTGRTQPPQ